MDNLHYAIFQVSWGWVGVLGTDKGLLRITLPKNSKSDALNELYLESSDASEDEATFSDLADKLKRYFKGEEVDFTNIAISMELLPSFEQAALQAAASIPYGQTVSYGELAARAGRPKAVRAAGQAMKRNPLPIIVPCHRVIKANGTIGGYNGKPELKQQLLRHEGVEIPC